MRRTRGMPVECPIDCCRVVRAVLSCAAVVSLLACGCRRAEPVAPVEPPGGFDGELALAECAAFFHLGPKPAGSAGAERAAEFIRERLTGAGIAAEVDTFADTVPGGTATFRNVIGTIPGCTPGLVVLAAHYDTKGGISDGFAGANDSASGVGLLLALAPVLRDWSWDGRPGIRLVFLDGEECRREYGPSDGLHGSRQLVARWRREGVAAGIRAFLLLDMVGDCDLTVTVPRNGTPALIKAVLDAAQAEGVRHQFALHDGQILDDHQPFLDAGIPAVDIIDFQYGHTRGGNEYWHTAADTMDKLDAASLRTVGRVVLRVLATLR